MLQKLFQFCFIWIVNSCDNYLNSRHDTWLSQYFPVRLPFIQIFRIQHGADTIIQTKKPTDENWLRSTKRNKTERNKKKTVGYQNSLVIRWYLKSIQEFWKKWFQDKEAAYMHKTFGNFGVPGFRWKDENASYENWIMFYKNETVDSDFDGGNQDDCLGNRVWTSRRIIQVFIIC